MKKLMDNATNMTQEVITAQAVIDKVSKLVQDHGKEQKPDIFTISLFRGPEQRNRREYPLVTCLLHRNNDGKPDYVFLGVSQRSDPDGEWRRIVTAQTGSYAYSKKEDIQMFTKKGDTGQREPLPLTRESLDETIKIARENMRRSGTAEIE